MLMSDFWLGLEVDADVESLVEEIQSLLLVSWLRASYKVPEQ
jgi:hypothetical protein